MCMRADGEDDIENTDWYEYPDIDDEQDCYDLCDGEYDESDGLNKCTGYYFDEDDEICLIWFRVDYEVIPDIEDEDACRSSCTDDRDCLAF